MLPRFLLITLRAFVRLLSAISPRAAGRFGVWLFCTPRRHRAPAWEHRLAARGTALRIGPGLAAHAFGSGPAVLLVHGWEGRGTQLGRFVEPLVAAGCRAIAIDLPAHGGSPGRRTDLIECTEALRRAVREAGPIAGVIAHSFGAAVVTLALERGMQASAAVLIAAPSSIANVLGRFAALTGLRGAATRAFQEALEKQAGVRLRDVEIFERVAALRVPALIVHDSDDREVPFEDAERLAARWPGATLLATRGHGHRRILKDETIVRRAVAFVTPSGAVF